MGDLRGWIRIAKHDLGKPQTPKMRGLKVFPNKHGDTDESESEDEEASRRKETDPDGFGVLIVHGLCMYLIWISCCHIRLATLPAFAATSLRPLYVMGGVRVLAYVNLRSSPQGLI